MGDVEGPPSMSGWIKGEGDTRTHASVALTRLPASLCRSDDIWHRLRRVGGSPHLMLVQTVAETRASERFDAISQQSVKQKTFVAFYAALGKTVSTQKDAGRSVDGR